MNIRLDTHIAEPCVITQPKEPALKEGRYFRLPERVSDLDRLWQEAIPVGLDRAPSWLTPEDAPHYRQVPSPNWCRLLPVERDVYLAELRELADIGLVIEEHPDEPGSHQVYLAAPRVSEVWSIGIYGGSTPFDFRPLAGVRNPVLTREDVTDVSATSVADPFLIRAGAEWYLFFEVMNWRSGKGEIGLATSDDGLHWTYRHIVLVEPFHLSYPYVFSWRGEYYMVPESFQAGAVRLYRATRFPSHWAYVGTLLESPFLADASVFRYRDRWWILADGSVQDRHDTLRLYTADELTGPWREHPQSPVVTGDPQHARPAGRVLVLEDRVFRYAQNCLPAYGTDVRCFEVTELTETSYRERRASQTPILGPSHSGWNAGGMHHVDPQCLSEGNWIASVDGWYLTEPVDTTLPDGDGQQTGRSG